MDDTWWAFVAQIDRAALMQELPGSASDRRMREAHAKRVRAARTPPPVSDELALERRHELVRSSRAWSEIHDGKRAYTRGASEQAQLEKELAAYAARKRTRKAA